MKTYLTWSIVNIICSVLFGLLGYAIVYLKKYG